MKKLSYIEFFSIRKINTNLIDNDLIFECICDAHSNIYHYAATNIQKALPKYNIDCDTFQIYFDNLLQVIPVYKTKHFNHYAVNQMIIDFLTNKI